MQTAAWDFTIDALDVTAVRVLAQSSGVRLFLFAGDMGAGKTTLIKAICKQLGVAEHTSSPTFSIVNTYQGAADILYHFDLFRLRNTEELEAIGFSEYLESGHYIFIEWPEIAMPILERYPKIHIQLTAPSPDVRHLVMTD